MTDIYVLIPAGGSGLRFGGIKKQFLELQGSTILNHSINLFLARSDVAKIVVSLPAEDLQHPSLIKNERVKYIAGGTTRPASVFNAFNTLKNLDDKTIVLIHDAARPWVSAHVIDRVVAAVTEFGAAVPAIKVTDTIKQIDENNIVVKTLPRDSLRAVQTPQGFWYGVLKKVYDQLDWCRGDRLVALTDEAMMVESLGHPVRVVEGDEGNVKVTTERDLKRL